MSNQQKILLMPLMVFCFFSCTKEKKALTPDQIQVKADSILKAAMPTLKQRAEEDLHNRLPIELKPKIDSILNISYNIPTPPQLKTNDQAETPFRDSAQ